MSLVTPAAQAQTADTVQVAAEECCLALLFPLGARPVGMGLAVAADTSADMLLYNPAGIAGLRRTELVVHYRKLPVDAQLLGLGLVWKPLSFGSFGLTWILLDGGSFEGTDTQGNPIGSIFTAMHVFAGTFATRLGKGVTGGISYKLFLMQAPCGNECDTGGASGSTQMVDLGLQYHPPFNRWASLGASLMNAGIPLQVVNFEQADQPPTRLRVGASYELLHHFQRDTTLTGSVRAQLETGGPAGLVPSFGAQVTVGDVVSVRGGWRSAGKAGDTLGGGVDTGLALGVGLKLQHYSIDVARALQTGALEESPFHITFGVSF